MITLYQFAPALGLPNASPFCMKLETYLRMAQLPFDIPRPTLAHMQAAPKGKLPYIVDGGRTLADTSLIIGYLKATYGDPVDGWMNAEQRALALAWQRLLEDHYYWVGVYIRWIEPAGWALSKQVFFKRLPVPLRWLVPPLYRRRIQQQLHGQGIGRHSAEEVHALGRQDLDALAQFLGDKPFLLGEQPCSVDAMAYALLANLLWVPLQHPLKTHAQQYPQLERFCQRMKSRYYA